MSTALSYPQLKAAVWADRLCRVHAVIDGAVVPGLVPRLAEAECNGWDCLQRGALAVEVAAKAGYLVELVEGSPFSDWLLIEATMNHPGWGLLLVTPQPLLATREHCRGLCEVTTPEGDRRRWRWWDPELLAALLPGCAPSQLDEIFALGQQMVLPARSAWTWYGLADGTLSTSVRQQMAPQK